MTEVKGFKVFNPDWTCRNKQYTCPGKFEEDVTPMMCNTGMHFCRRATDCFNYYKFNPENHVAEVIAYGDIAENGDKTCTNKLEIVRDYLLNGINQYQIAKNYGIGQQSVSRIIRNFASSNDKSALLMKNRPTDSQADEIKALREEVMELKKKLHSETMRADFYDTMIDVAEEMFNIEIRKKAGTGQSKGCTKTK